jgi:hypothetical protein
MARASLGIWTGAGLFLLLAGCSPSDLVSGWLTASASPNGDRVIAGSLTDVANSTQASLMRVGFSVARTTRGDSVYLSSKTPAGERFTLVLTQEKTYQGDRVRARVDWQDQVDPQTHQQVMAHASASVGS